MKLLSVLLLLAVVAHVFASVAETKRSDDLAVVESEIGVTNHVLDKRDAAKPPTHAQRVANHRRQKLRRIRARKLNSIRARKAAAARRRRARRNRLAARRG
ncbi:hypothetical protein AAVH_06468 [Aphelenchoides avenae]|nr:hypothetical protein AAVH_06468 [Aphelenchus avenae]